LAQVSVWVSGLAQAMEVAKVRVPAKVLVQVLATAKELVQVVAKALELVQVAVRALELVQARALVQQAPVLADKFVRMDTVLMGNRKFGRRCSH
jgi:hypothetical protein